MYSHHSRLLNTAVLAGLALFVLFPSSARSQTIVEAMYESTVASIDTEGRPTDVTTGDPIMILVRYDADAMPTSQDDPMSAVFSAALLALEITLPETGDFFVSDETALVRLLSQLDDDGFPGFLLTDAVLFTADLASAVEIGGIVPLATTVSLTENLVGPGAPNLVVDARTLPSVPPDVDPFGSVELFISLATESPQVVNIVGDSVSIVPVPEPSSLAAALTSLSCVWLIASFRERDSRAA